LKVLITGGAGFIGQNLVRKMQAQIGYTPIIFDDFSIGDKELAKQTDATIIYGDIQNAESIAKAIKGVSAIVHLAASSGVIDSIANPQQTFERNVTGTSVVLEQARLIGVKSFVFASTGGAIVGDNETPPFNETLPMAPISPYGASKMCGEALCMTYARAYGMRNYILRFSNVYGPYSLHKKGAVVSFMKSIKTGRPIIIYGDGSQVRDFIHVNDICSAIIDALKGTAKPDTYNIGSGKPTSILELAHITMEVADLNESVETVYKPVRDGEVMKTWLNIERAARELNFTPKIDLRNGLATTWDWFNKTNITELPQ
tara:strand:+ start:28713 stop:29657 length:945 start_codon:yes stop_codon:yes gene_type:complete